MRVFINTGIFAVLWIINLFNGTGLDYVYDVTQWGRRLVIFCTIFYIVIKYIKKKVLVVNKTDAYVYGAMFSVFIVSPFINGYGFDGIDYLWVFCIIYILSKIELDDKSLFFIGLSYGVAGFVVLYIYNYGTVFKGWNENSIAMLGMYSFLMLLVPFFKENKLKNKIILLVVTFIFSSLISATNSRSGTLFMFLGVLLAINLLPRKIFNSSNFVIIFWLLVPLIVAIIVVVISKTPIIKNLDSWSIDKFNKPIFNGRDILFQTGIDYILLHPLFGNGRLSFLNWHNSAIACLVPFGIVGYTLWIMSFNKILSKATDYLNDYLVVGCFTSFMVLYIQQTVELGFISHSPNLLAYVMLGAMLGRIKFIKNRQMVNNTQPVL